MFQSLAGQARADDRNDADAPRPEGSESSEDVRLLFEAIPVAMLILRPDVGFTIAAASNLYRKEAMCEQQDIVGKTVFDIFPPCLSASPRDAATQLRMSLHYVVKNRTRHVMGTQGYGVAIPGASSETRLWRVQNVPVLAGDGSLLCIVHCVENCTDHAKRQEEKDVLVQRFRGLQTALSDSNVTLLRRDNDLKATAAALEALTQNAEAWRLGNEKFRLIVDALPLDVWTALPDGELDFHNRRFGEHSGVAKEAAIDGMWVSVVHPDDLPSALDAWRHSLTTGEPYEVTFRVRNVSDTYRWTLARALAVRDESGAIVKWIGANTDIHEKVTAEQELRDAHRRKDEFLAMLAHELRNPLVPIGAGAETLLMLGNDDARVSQISEMIRRQIQHVTGLIDDLLDVSRVTQGRVALERRTVDVRQVVQDSVEQMRPLLETHRHRLTMHLPPEAVCVCGDHKRLVQVVTNLLGNSAKYTPDGGEITIRLACTNEEAVLRVKDNGIGMDPDLVRRAFDLFQQGERSPARAEGGLGLGLALVKSLIEQQRGAVSAASGGPGQGTELTVRLPVTHELPVSLRAAVAAEEKPTQHHRHRILLVDDNVDVADSVGMVLDIMGHDVRVEHDAQSAIERAKHEWFDRCILDIGLPGMTGYELARELRTIPGTRDAVFVAHTGYGQKEDRRLSSEAGFKYHLVKPVAIPELERVLADETMH